MIKKLINLVKIAKQKLDEQEKLLSRNQTVIAQKKSSIDSINAQISAVPMKMSGDFRDYRNRKLTIDAYVYEIEELQFQIGLLKKEQENIKKAIRIAHLEHEKMLYLYNQEKDKLLLEQNRMENNALNEITVLLHSHKKNRESKP